MCGERWLEEEEPVVYKDTVKFQRPLWNAHSEKGGVGIIWGCSDIIRSPIGHLCVSQGRVSDFTKQGLRGSEKELGTVTTMIQKHPIAVHSKARRQTVDRSGVSPLWSVLFNVDRMQWQLRVCPGSTPNPRFRVPWHCHFHLLPGSQPL